MLKLLLGDLGRHGTSPVYQNLSKFYKKVRQSKKQVNCYKKHLQFFLNHIIVVRMSTDKRCTIFFQNFTQDNHTQGIMEKSQWDLKKIRFQRKRLRRLDDFVQIYQKMHDALILEYKDVERCSKKVWNTFCFLLLLLTFSHLKTLYMLE